MSAKLAAPADEPRPRLSGAMRRRARPSLRPSRVPPGGSLAPSPAARGRLAADRAALRSRRIVSGDVGSKTTFASGDPGGSAGSRWPGHAEAAHPATPLRRIALEKTGESGAEVARFLRVTMSSVNRLAVSPEPPDSKKFPNAL